MILRCPYCGGSNIELEPTDLTRRRCACGATFSPADDVSQVEPLANDPAWREMPDE